MRSPTTAFKDYLRSYPLSDRATLVYESRSAVLFGIFNGLALPLVGVVGRKLGMDSGQLALLMTSQFVGLLLNLWFGHLARSGDLVAYVFWPGVLSRLAVAFVALAISPVAFLVAMGFYFVVSSIGGPAYSSIMRSNYSDAHRGRAMGHLRIMIMAISALCAEFAGAFLQAFPGGYRILFPIAGILGIISAFFFRKLKPRRRAQELSVHAESRASFMDSLGILRKDRAFLAFMAIYFIVGFPDKVLISLEPIRLVDELGAGYGVAGLLLGTIPLAAGVLGYFIFARLAHKWDAFILLLATVILSSTRFLGFALATSPLHLIPGLFLNGISSAGWDLLPLFTLLLFADSSRLGLYMGLHNTLVGIRGLIGPALGTWLYAGLGMKISDIYWLAFAIELTGAALMFLFWTGFRRGTNRSLNHGLG